MNSKEKRTILPINIQLFAEGGESATTSEATAETTDTQVEATEGAEDAQGDQSNQINEEEVEQISQETRKTEFEKMIKNEYKEQFAQRTQQIIDKRFKEAKLMEESHKKMQPMLQKLSSKYGITGNDIEALSKAIDGDDSFYEKYANEHGLTVDQARNIKNLEVENAQLRQTFEERQRQEETNEIYAKWASQAEQTKQLYPDFDLGVEMQESESFTQLVQAGIDIKTAYEVAHKDEILTRVATISARKAEKKVVDNIKAKGNRPAENGMSSQGSVSVSKDISKLTNDEIDDYIKRARQGETIDFSS